MCLSDHRKWCQLCLSVVACFINYMCPHQRCQLARVMGWCHTWCQSIWRSQGRVGHGSHMASRANGSSSFSRCQWQGAVWTLLPLRSRKRRRNWLWKLHRAQPPPVFWTLGPPKYWGGGSQKGWTPRSLCPRSTAACGRQRNKQMYCANYPLGTSVTFIRFHTKYLSIPSWYGAPITVQSQRTWDSEEPPFCMSFIYGSLAKLCPVMSFKLYSYWTYSHLPTVASHITEINLGRKDVWKRNVSINNQWKAIPVYLIK